MTEQAERYELLEEIGRGGFAVVYRAHDSQLDRLVALKELRPLLLSDPASVEDFRREARNIARLDHPNVVTIYDVYEAGQRQFIVMQLVDGTSLEERIATRGRLPWPEALKIVAALATGLDYAHSRGILHRDLKPANILLDSNHGPMLSDFGLAKLMSEAGGSMTAAGNVVGTPNYIAPEVWEGEGTTPQSDIYALGCVLFEMLTGQKLFAGETPPAVMMAHFKPLALPEGWPGDVPPGVGEVLATALAPNPAHRFAAAAEMARALAALTAPTQPSPTPPPAPKPAAPPILSTKLYPPPTRPEFVPRPRLIERLNDGLRAGRKLTLVSAAAGFGKTTLVSSWLNQKDEGGRITDESGQILRPSSFITHPSNVAWLSLDDGDSDLSRFFSYVVAALQTVAPNIGASVLGALQAPQPPSIESILTGLVNEIAATPDKLILVLDDYHEVESKRVDQALAFLLDHLPPQLHLVIATREDPPLPLARLRVRGQLTELRVADLRFTPAEAGGFLNQAMGLQLSKGDIDALEARTEGWIAGLQLAALSMQGQRDAAGFIQSFTGSHHFVLDYLVEEVLHRQPERVQTFLLRTSILDRLSGPLCDAVLDSGAEGQRRGGERKESPLLLRRALQAGQQPAGRGGERKESPLLPRSSAPLLAVSGQQTLEYLHQANLFIVPLDNERRWYRYHHLFADLLRQRLRQSASDEPGLVADLHGRASRWFERHDSPAEAIHHALAAQDFERAAALLERVWPSMDGSFQSAIWLNWARVLPEALIEARPVLSMAYTWALLDGGELEAAEIWLRNVERWLDSSAAPAGQMVVDEEHFRMLPGSVATARAYLAQAFGDGPGSVAHARQALKLAPDDDHVRRGQAGSLLALAYWANGELEAAHRTFAAAMDDFRANGNIVFAISGTYGLADIRLAQGRLREAVTIYNRSMQLVAAQDNPALPGTADLYLGLGDLQREQGNLAAAGEYLAKSEALGEPAALPDWPYRFRLVQSRLKAARGDLAGALDLLTEAEPLFFRSPMPTVRPIGALKARLWLAQGRLAEAAAWARERNLSIDDDLNFLNEFEHITLARILIAQATHDQAAHDFDAAIDLLMRLLAAAEAGDRGGSVIEILLLQALAYRAQGDSAKALASLERALSLAEPEGYVQIFVDEGAPMAELLARMKDEGGRLKGYIGRLLVAFPDSVAELISPPDIEAANAELVEPLSERELEVLQLVAAGLSNREISERLFLALSTVKGHNRAIFGKLQVQRRTEAVARARELGLL